MTYFLRIIIVCLTLCSMALAQPNLKRGVNLSHWYAQSTDGDYSEPKLSTYFTSADVQLIKQMGFDHVRLTLNDEVVFQTIGKLKADNVDRLRKRIDAFVDAGLNVIVDLHPETKFKERLATPMGAAALVADWHALATALADTDPDKVALEVLNEPDPMTADQWRGVQLAVVRVMRAAAPKHTIIVSPGGWTSADDLIKFIPYEGIDRLVYTFHFYDPHLYTHQSAGWAWVVAQRVGGIDWPIEPARADAVANEVAKDDEARGHVRWQIQHGQFADDSIRTSLQRVADWQKKHGVDVYAGEFGVYRHTAVRAGYLRWHTTVRETFEQHGWGWAVWDYAGGFAVAPGKPGARVPDAEMLKALGLR